MLPLPETTVATRRNIARKYKLAAFPAPRPFLHIRCGDDILGCLDQAGIPGDKVKWADPICEGPLHLHADPLDRLKERAAYVSRRFDLSMTEALRDLAGADWRVDQCVEYDETVLWFEADLFDQAILVYLLARLGPLLKRIRLSLICIGAYPGVERFIGLGQLTPGQLATLLPERRPVTRGQVRLATAAWQALNAPDPRGLIALAARRSRALPFLPAALSRYLAEYPSRLNGLSLTAQRALESVAAGAGNAGEAFVAVQNREVRPFMGDWMFYAMLLDLAAPPRPAIRLGRSPGNQRLDSEFRRRTLRLTDVGRALLAGEADWCRLNGAVRQVGGVTLRGAALRWRWDPERERLIERRSR